MTTTYEYDALDRVTRVKDSLNNETKLTYNALGLRSSAIDGNGHQTNYSYDALSRLVKIEQKGIAPSAITTFAYDAMNNLVRVTDPEGKTTVYAYDALSRRTQVTQPLGQAVRYSYDDAGRLENVVNARGQKVEYQYAVTGRLYRVNYYSSETSAAPTKHLQYEQDLSGNVLSITDTGVGSSPLYEFTYDEMDRIDVTTLGYLPVQVSLDNNYDRYGNRNQLILQDGSAATQSFTYNKLNQLSMVNFPGGQSPSINSYPDANLLKKITFNSGVADAYLYTNAGMLQSITTTGATGTIDQLRYSYDQALNASTKNSTRDGGLQIYGYDGLDRLTTATYPSAYGIANESFVYDRVGNRALSSDVSQYNYDDNHRLTQALGLSYGYDNDGNQTGRNDGMTLTYDTQNRLTGYSKGGSQPIMITTALADESKRQWGA